VPIAPAFRKLLLIRLDRIGDLVLTLPVDEALDSTAVDWWIPPELEFVSAMASPPRKTRTINKKISVPEFFRLLPEVRRRHYDAAIIFHAPWWVSLLLWLARIPIRAGVRSQWHSFFFLNRTIRQKRSRAEFSELEYNFKLFEAVLNVEPGVFPRTSLNLHSEVEREFLLRRHGIKPGSYNVVHPGMGGSALNWPTTKYLDLIRSLTARDETVVITGTAADTAYLHPLREALGELHNIIWLDDKLTGRELVTLLGAARTVFAPSTGVLHLAASTGTPTIGIFSPVRVQHPRRWGPIGRKVATLVPDGVICPGELKCLGSSCRFFDCMETIAVSEVLKARTSLLQSSTAIETV
jgi:ADP-heptose:LPS heptosyltransferase